MGDARNWQGPAARKKAGRPTGNSRRPLILGLLFVILALAGVLAGFLLFLQGTPDPLLVVIRVDQYPDPLPISPWSDQDCAALRGTNLKEHGAFTSQVRQRLSEELKNLGSKQRKDQPLIIYLCAYATGVENDGVALLPADARLDDPASWLSFKEVLDALKACGVKKRLLLLDLALPCAVPRAGLLANDVPDHLQRLLAAAVQADPDLQVLTSCSPGQVSLASEELGHTVFAHYIAQGLLGGADGFLPNTAPDHRVTVQELQTYVKTQVDRWAWHNRKVRQTPAFFGSTTDYPLTSVEAPTPLAPTPLAKEYPPFLQRPWKERDRWWNDRASLTPPALYRQLENDALRAEERWRGSEDVAKVKAFLDPRVDRLLARQRDEKTGGDGGEPRSLAQVVAGGQKPPALSTEAVRELKELATLYTFANQPKPNEKDVMRLAKETERVLKKYEGKPFDLAWTVFTVAAAEDAPRQEHLRCWYGLLQPEGQPPPVYAETRFLKRLADWRVEKPADWPAAAAGDALRLTAEAEKVEAGNPRLQPWLKNAYAEAAAKRRTAEDLFFHTDLAKRAAAPPALGEALAQFRSLGASLSALNDAQRLRDEGLVFLPAYPPYLDFDAANEKAWEDAARTTRELDDLLAQPVTGAAPPETLRRVGELATILRNSLNLLRQPMAAAWVKGPIDERQPVSGADAVETSALLQLPGPTAVERLTLWNNYRAVAGRLQAEAVAREKSTDALSAYDGAVAVRQERARALVRARASLTLLQLVKAADAPKVEAELQKVTRTPTEEAARLSLGRALRRAWKQYETDRAGDEK